MNTNPQNLLDGYCEMIGFDDFTVKLSGKRNGPGKAEYTLTKLYLGKDGTAKQKTLMKSGDFFKVSQRFAECNESRKVQLNRFSLTITNKYGYTWVEIPCGSVTKIQNHCYLPYKNPVWTKKDEVYTASHKGMTLVIQPIAPFVPFKV